MYVIKCTTSTNHVNMKFYAYTNIASTIVLVGLGTCFINNRYVIAIIKICLAVWCSVTLCYDNDE